ncbi:MAG: transcriptional regulator, MerR family [Herbinix sp.]|jgi:DNA-binding transcriptional MerR regulator|nr:transcriptional regulator, MerR family [Herbinix sp.]
MDGYIKIGELASMTGITVRTLHYYDEIGILKPSHMTESGHRLYDMQCVTSLYRIMAMKDLGFNLTDISDIIKTKNIDISELVEMQIANIQEEIAQKQLLFSKLLKLKQGFKANQNISLDDFKAMVPFINASADKYFSKEQFYKMRTRLEGFNSGSEANVEWISFIAKLNHCYKNNLAYTDLNAVECVDYWKNLMSKFVGEDEHLKNSVLSFHASIENSQLRYGLTDELYKYLMGLMK